MQAAQKKAMGPGHLDPRRAAQPAPGGGSSPAAAGVRGPVAAAAAPPRKGGEKRSKKAEKPAKAKHKGKPGRREPATAAQRSMLRRHEQQMLKELRRQEKEESALRAELGRPAAASDPRRCLAYDGAATAAAGNDRADEWVADETQACCSNRACESAFGFFNRRHHCRACGLIFCSRCVATRMPLGEGERVFSPRRSNSRTHRVCGGCKGRLQGKKVAGQEERRP
jgi:hypothetical protein